MKTVYGLILIAIAFISCNNNVNQHQENTNDSIVEKENSSKLSLFSKNGLGDFTFNKTFADNTNSAYQTKDTLIFDEGEESFYKLIYKSDTLRLVVSLSPDDSIYEMTLSSPEYTNSEQLGVGSRLKDILKTYNDFDLFYTCVSDRFVVNSKQTMNVQFIIDPKAFKGNKKKLNKGDMVVLKPDEFMDNAKIINVRIYRPDK